MSTFIGLKSHPQICEKISLLTKFGDEVVRKFGTEYTPEVVGVFGDEFVPKSVAKKIGYLYDQMWPLIL